VPFNSGEVNEIPILIPDIPTFESVLKYLKRIDSAKKYSNFGPLNEELLNRLALHLNLPVAHLQTASNATQAIEGAILTSGVSENEWEMPSWTFAATAHAAIRSGARVRLVDVSIDNWRASFSGERSNLIDVLPFGDGIDLHRLPSNFKTLLIDGAASFVALKNCSIDDSRKIGVVLSLHATKLLPAGEGAVFFSNCSEWSKRFKQWTNYGFNDDRQSQFLATNAKLSEYSAAIALSALDNMESTFVQLSQKMNTVRALSKTFNLGVHPAMSKGILTPYWIVKLSDAKQKTYLRESLNAFGVMSRDWWSGGCHLHPAFAQVPKTSLDSTQQLFETTLGLPFHNYLSSDDISRIKRALNRFVECLEGAEA